MLTYFISFFKPKIEYKDSSIILTVRGIKVVASSDEELRLKIEQFINKLRQQLSDDYYNSTKMWVRGNKQWNVGTIFMRNSKKNLEAFENYYYENWH